MGARSGVILEAFESLIQLGNRAISENVHVLKCIGALLGFQTYTLWYLFVKFEVPQKCIGSTPERPIDMRNKSSENDTEFLCRPVSEIGSTWT